MSDTRGSREGRNPAGRQCSFCGGAGERIIEVEIDGFINEIVVDCPHG